MARSMLKGYGAQYSIKSNKILKSKKDNVLSVYDSENDKTISVKMSRDDDLIFLKENESNQDPLKVWCKQFLREYSQNDTVNEAIERVPSYKPTQTQIKSLQKKREKDLLKWGSQF